MEEKAQFAGEFLFSMLREKKMIIGNRTVDVELVERQSVIEAGRSRLPE